MALSEDPAAGAVRGWRTAESWARAGLDAPGRTNPQGGTHWLSISSQRGAGGHRVEKGVVGIGAGELVVGGGPVGAQQPSLLLSGTSQVLPMSWQVGAMVPSGRRQSSILLLVQVPGECGSREGHHRGQAGTQPFPSPHPSLVVTQL